MALMLSQSSKDSYIIQMQIDNLNNQPHCLDKCWRCETKSTFMFLCERCQFVSYCSNICLNNDKIRHKAECENFCRVSTCSNCGKRESELELPLQSCAKCKLVYYCSMECQGKHRVTHNKLCHSYMSQVLEFSKRRTLPKYQRLPFYIQNVAAVDFLNLQNNEGLDYNNTIKLLLVGPSDLNHVVQTVVNIPEQFKQPVYFVLTDLEPHLMARNFLLLYVALTHLNPEFVLHVWYSLKLTEERFQNLVSVLKYLVSNARKTILEEIGARLMISGKDWIQLKAVWNGWIELSENPKNLEQLLSLRQEKIGAKSVSTTAIPVYTLLTPQQHKESIYDWFDQGLLLGMDDLALRSEMTKVNFTFGCFNPRYEKNYNGAPGPSSEDNLPLPESKMIYSPEGFSNPFYSWDYCSVVKEVGVNPDLLQMYYEYLIKILERFIAFIASSKIQIKLIICDENNMKRELRPDGYFDRVYWTSTTDYALTPKCVEISGTMINRKNQHAVLITETAGWARFIGPMYFWNKVLELYDTVLDDNLIKPISQVIANNQFDEEETRAGVQQMLLVHLLEDFLDLWLTFDAYLLAEFLLYRVITEKITFSMQNIESPNSFAKKFNLKLRNYANKHNKVVPFSFKATKRFVSNFSFVRRLEWELP